MKSCSPNPGFWHVVFCISSRVYRLWDHYSTLNFFVLRIFSAEKVNFLHSVPFLVIMFCNFKFFKLLYFFTKLKNVLKTHKYLSITYESIIRHYLWSIFCCTSPNLYLLLWRSIIEKFGTSVCWSLENINSKSRTVQILKRKRKYLSAKTTFPLWYWIIWHPTFYF